MWTTPSKKTMLFFCGFSQVSSLTTARRLGTGLSRAGADMSYSKLAQLEVLLTQL